MKLISSFQSITNPTNRSFSCSCGMRGYFFIALVLAWFALCPLPKAFALTPAPDGGYPGGNTAEGQIALFSLTTGFYNTAVGIFSLESLTDGSFDTATGAGTLLVHTGDI